MRDTFVSVRDGGGAFARPITLGAVLALLLSACGGGIESPDGATDDVMRAEVMVADSARDAISPCTSAASCDDHVYCNGVEQCSPGAPGANASGCVRASAGPCAGGMACNEMTHACTAGDGGVEGGGDPCDMDGDGHRAPTIACGGDDCDDHDFYRHPMALEYCDGNLPDGRPAANHDEDCNACTVYNALGPPDGDQDSDRYPSSRCSNPWLTAVAPPGCDMHVVNVVPPIAPASMGVVRGADCDDDPGPARADGDAGADAAHDARADVATDAHDAVAADAGRALTGQDIHPGQTEACNGIDDNCNGQVDEGAIGSGGSCGSGLPGACGPGTNQCVNGAITCVPDVAAVAEVCNGMDDDCDGVVDNGDPGGGAACMTGMTGVCAAGTMVCMAGTLACQRSHNPTPEVQCNGLDDDCAPATPDVPMGACYTLPGMLNTPQGGCHQGSWTCSGAVPTCAAQQGPVTDVCNGRDDDCDNVIDDVNGRPTDQCFNSTRACSVCGTVTGTESCDNTSCNWSHVCAVTPPANPSYAAHWSAGAGAMACSSSSGEPATSLCLIAVCAIICVPYTGTSPTWTGLGGPEEVVVVGLRLTAGSCALTVQSLLLGAWTNTTSSTFRAPFNGAFTDIAYNQGTACAAERLSITCAPGTVGSVDGILAEAQSTSFPD